MSKEHLPANYPEWGTKGIIDLFSAYGARHREAGTLAAWDTEITSATGPEVEDMQLMAGSRPMSRQDDYTFFPATTTIRDWDEPPQINIVAVNPVDGTTVPETSVWVLSLSSDSESISASNPAFTDEQVRIVNHQRLAQRAMGIPEDI